MNTKVAITVTLLAILCVGLMGQAFAQTRAPGVSRGDTFTYKVTSHWSTENATEPEPVGLTDVNNTASYKVQISDVSGVNATATYTWELKNGTQFAFLLTQDVESGQSYYHSYNAPPLEILVGANIQAGELLHPTGDDTYTVNQTISRNYADGARDTNLIEITFPIQNNETDTTIVGSSTTRFYIDKATGVIVEQDTEIEHTTTPKESLSIVWELTDTNLWNAAETATFELSLTMIIAIVAVIAVVVVILAVFFMRSRGHRGKSR
jgi:hypothetical protein